eukprot:PITA_19350
MSTKKLINFCTEHGIKLQHIVPYSPQQNGVAERKNHTLKEMANYEKHKALEPKIEKCIFVGYSENVKGYRLLTPKSKNVIIRRYVKFVENISSYDPSSADVPPLSILSTSENISSLDDDSEDDNPPPPSKDPPSAQIPKWVCATQDTTSALAEASGHPDRDAAVNEEYRSLLANDIWDLVPLPKGGKLVRCKCVYRTKFLQMEKLISIKLILLMDVKSASLLGDLHEEIYMEQPPGFIQIDYSLVCRLKKSVYGLKQAPRAWYAKMDSFVLDTGFSRCHSDNIV